jgi:hypothetical protein
VRWPETNKQLAMGNWQDQNLESQIFIRLPGILSGADCLVPENHKQLAMGNGQDQNLESLIFIRLPGTLAGAGNQ